MTTTTTLMRKELERNVRRDRLELKAALERVELAARHQLDVSRRIAERRWIALGASFCLGFVLGATWHTQGGST